MTHSCNRCETDFDPDREPQTPGANTSRCPACGCEHDLKPREPRGALAADGGGVGATVEIHVEEGGTVVLGEQLRQNDR